MIPLFVMMAIYYGNSVSEGEPQMWQRYAAVIIFLVAAASDGIDGYVARRFNQKSQLGAILDPIADKGLLLSGIITLSFTNWDLRLPIWFAVIVIARDVVIIIGTALLHLMNGNVSVKPSWIGKVATVLQMSALACVMLHPAFATAGLHFGSYTFSFFGILVFLAGSFTAVSGFGYVMDGLRQLHDKGHGQPK